MAGVFKSLDKSDVRLTPFRTHKLWADHLYYCDYTYQYTSASFNLPTGAGDSLEVMASNPDRVYSINVSGNSIAKLNVNDNYEVIATGPSLSGNMTYAKFNEQSSGAYILVVEDNNTFKSYDEDFTLLTSVLTTTPITIGRDASYEASNQRLYFCGTGGVGYISYNGTTFGAETNISSTHPTYTQHYTKICAKGLGECGSVAYVHSGSNGIHILDDNGGVGTVSNAANAAATGSCTKLIYGTEGTEPGYDRIYYALFGGGFLQAYSVDATFNRTVVSNVGDIIESSLVYELGTSNYDTTRQVHVLSNDGYLYLDFKHDYTNNINAPAKVVDLRKYVGTSRTLKGTINADGLIGIYAYSTSSLTDSIFLTVNVDTYEVSNLKHLGSINAGYLQGSFLNTILGVSSDPGKFVDYLCESSLDYTIYKADYNPIASHANTDPLKVNFDQGNPHFQYDEPLTAQDKFQRVVHKSIDHLYYRNFYDNNRATFGGGNINEQYRFLEDQAQVVSLPQSKFGESIHPGSVQIKANLYTRSGSNYYDQQLTIEDDIYGNLAISGAYTSSYGNMISGSVSKVLAGSWPFDNLYKYIGKGVVNVTSSFNRGQWPMKSYYKNITFTTLTGTAPVPSPDNMLGVVPYFTASLSSSIKIKADNPSEYAQNYNFENGNFSISFLLYPQQTPTHTSGSILISKEGPAEDLRIDQNGNVYTIPASNRSPYRISLSTSRQVVFERNTNVAQAYVSSSALSLNKLYHIAAVKSGSMMQLYVDGVLVSSGSDVAENRLCSNLSDIHIGNSYDGKRGFSGVIDGIKIYKDILTQADVTLLRETLNEGNSFVGNVFYTNGMMVLSSIPSRYMDITNVKSRGTHTIWETEISCTIGPGEFTRSMNPTLQVYDPTYNQFVFTPFATGSEFAPFVTTVGLYDDKHRLVAVAKLNTPIQLPNNTDTTIIVRFDR